MKRFLFTMMDENGLHARPAGKLATTAKQFASEITLTANEKTADCKRLLALMGLGVRCGDELRFCIAGEDEDAAKEALENFCHAQLNGGGTE